MKSYYELEQLANYQVARYQAEADLERLRAEARRAHADARRGPAAAALLARFLLARIRRNHPPVLSFENTGS